MSATILKPYRHFFNAGVADTCPFIVVFHTNHSIVPAVTEPMAPKKRIFLGYGTDGLATKHYAMDLQATLKTMV